MSDDIQSGFRGAVKGVLLGIVFSTFLVVMKGLPLVPSSYVGIFQLIEIGNLVGSIFLVFAMESWGTGYLIGWLFSIWIMSSSGLVEYWLFVIYVIVGVPVLIGRILQKVKKFF